MAEGEEEEEEEEEEKEEGEEEDFPTYHNYKVEGEYSQRGPPMCAEELSHL